MQAPDSSVDPPAPRPPLLDRDLAWAGGRSPRELIILAGGLALCCSELLDPRALDVGNFLVYVLATAAFAVRVYFARAAAVGACVGALAQQWPHLRFGLDHVDAGTLGVFPLLALALLASPDLVRRFERETSRHRWLPNHWAPFTATQTRTIRWSIYSAGALAGLLDHTLQLSRHHVMWAAVENVPVWPRVAMISIVVCAGLLVLGRAIGLIGLWLTSLVVAALIAPHAWAAEQWLLARDFPESAQVFWSAKHYLSPALLLAVITVITSTPFVLRLLRRVFLRAAPSEPSADLE